MIPTWTLIIWVLHHQLALPGYRSADECEAGRAATAAAAIAQRNVVTTYCIPGPSKWKSDGPG